jgi:hypothetical protein
VIGPVVTLGILRLHLAEVAEVAAEALSIWAAQTQVVVAVEMVQVDRYLSTSHKVKVYHRKLNNKEK